MFKVGTLKELDVKPGDVVANVSSGTVYTITDVRMGDHYFGRQDGDTFKYSKLIADHMWSVEYRAFGEPKTWGEMSDEEKGALLLAYHEGKVIEWNAYPGGPFQNDSTESEPVWDNNHVYRVKPEPVVETVTMEGACFKTCSGVWRMSETGLIGECTHHITFDLVDGEPDCGSIKMEKI